jgi:hypothetical protein
MDLIRGEEEERSRTGEASRGGVKAGRFHLSHHPKSLPAGLESCQRTWRTRSSPREIRAREASPPSPVSRTESSRASAGATYVAS